MVGPLDDPVRERCQADDHENLTDGIDPARPLGARLGHEPVGGKDRQRADRHVHQEDGPPADGADQHAAEHGPERDAEPEHRRVHADRAGPLGRIDEHGADDRHRHRAQHRAADRLKHPGGDQNTRCGRQRAQQRTEREHEQAELEHALAPDAVGGGTGQHEQACQNAGCTRPPSTAARPARSPASGGWRAARCSRSSRRAPPSAGPSSRSPAPGGERRVRLMSVTVIA